MDVRLPDGTIIRGVPDGTTRDELTAKLKANGYSFEEPKAEPAKVESGLLERVGRAVRMLTPGGLATSLLSPEGRADVANEVAGGVKGASNLGATLVAPLDVAADAAAGKGLTLEANRQRRQDVTNALASFGADPESPAFKAGQLTTEVGGTLPIGGVAGKVVSKVAPRLGQAVETAGLSTGARVLPTAGAKAADLGIRAAGGAINGGLTAAAVNPQDSPLGVGVGAVSPAAVKVAGAAGNALGSIFMPTVANSRAVNKLAETLGSEGKINQTVADLQTYFPKGAEDIPLSAAAVTGNPELALLEQGSRVRSSPAWFNFDQKQGKAVYDNVMKATGEADEIGARAGARNENWKAAWQAASEAQKPRVWVRRMNGFYDNVNQAMQSAESSNPAVRKVLEEVQTEMERLGPAFGPGNLQQLRANLNGKVNPMSPDAFKSAPRDNPAIISIKQEMDDILNASTGGKWQKVLEGYAQDSEALHASKAAAKVRGAFIDQDTGRVLGTALDPDGAVPKITEAGLDRSIKASRMADKTNALSAPANQRLEATLDALRRQKIVQQLKGSATAGGGSDTIPNAVAAGAAQAAGAPNLLVQLAGAARQLGTAKTDNALAALLANPDELAAALSRYLSAPPNRLVSGGLRAAPALASGQ